MEIAGTRRIGWSQTRTFQLRLGSLHLGTLSTQLVRTLDERRGESQSGGATIISPQLVPVGCWFVAARPGLCGLVFLFRHRALFALFTIIILERFGIHSIHSILNALWLLCSPWPPLDYHLQLPRKLVSRRLDRRIESHRNRIASYRIAYHPIPSHPIDSISPLPPCLISCRSHARGPLRTCCGFATPFPSIMFGGSRRRRPPPQVSLKLPPYAV